MELTKPICGTEMELYYQMGSPSIVSATVVQPALTEEIRTYSFQLFNPAPSENGIQTQGGALLARLSFGPENL